MVESVTFAHDGEGQHFSNVLAMTQAIATAGNYPDRSGDSGFTIWTFAMVHNFVGRYPVFGGHLTDGARLPVRQHTALYSLLENRFGGTPGADFELPGLSGRVAVGATPGMGIGATGLGMTHLIATRSLGPRDPGPLAGMIALFAGNFAPGGWLPADGRLVEIEAYPELFTAIGTRFGGDGKSRFALPDLEGRSIIGAGARPGTSGVRLGQEISGFENGDMPALGLNYLLCIEGMFPDSQGKGDIGGNSPFLGQVVAYAGSTVPEGWMPADGRTITLGWNPPGIHQILFSLMGNLYGGDGYKSFALPDLRGRMIMGR